MLETDPSDAVASKEEIAGLNFESKPEAKGEKKDEL